MSDTVRELTDAERRYVWALKEAMHMAALRQRWRAHCQQMVRWNTWAIAALGVMLVACVPLAWRVGWGDAAFTALIVVTAGLSMWIDRGTYTQRIARLDEEETEDMERLKGTLL